MGESRRTNEVVFQPKGEKPLPGPYPQVSYRDRVELRAAVERAVRHYWRGVRRVHVEVSYPWQECRGQAVFDAGMGPREVRFFPVHDPGRPEHEQARPQTVSVQLAPRVPAYLRQRGRGQ